MPGVLADSDEEDSEMEYYDFKLPPVKAIAEYQVYNWAKVDCDIEDKLAEQNQIAQWPTFQYFRNGEQIAEMHGYTKQKLNEWMKNPKDDKISCPQAPEPLPPYEEPIEDDDSDEPFDNEDSDDNKDGENEGQNIGEEEDENKEE